MIIHTLRALKDNFIYVLDDESGNCAVIDPGEAKPVMDFLNERGLRLQKIFCTHRHWDHVDGVEELVAAFPVPVACSKFDLASIPCATEGLEENGSYSIFGHEMRILALPGHTLGQIGLYFPEKKALFSGDTLFSCGCGRLFEGTHEQMFASLAKIKNLPPDTLLYFGHEYTLRSIQFVKEKSKGSLSPALDTYERECAAKIQAGHDTSPGKLSIELEVNPFLKAESVAEFKSWRDARDAW